MRYFQQKVEIHWQELVNEMFLASELEKKKSKKKLYDLSVPRLQLFGSQCFLLKDFELN